MLYTVYLPKKKGTRGIITKWLEYYSKLTCYRNNLIMSPGYLSKSENRINMFVTSLKNTMYPHSPFKIGILNGMNGHYIMPSGNTILECHEIAIGGMNDVDWLKLKSNGLVDHRKIMVFYSEIGNMSLTSISSEKEIEEFLGGINVNAVLLGSSNQSCTTYFDRKAKKGEADIFMMSGSEKCGSFPTINSMLLDVKNSVSNRDNIHKDNSIYRDIDRNIVIEKARVFLEEYCTMSVGFAGKGNSGSEEFLKGILRNVLEDGISK